MGVDPLAIRLACIVAALLLAGTIAGQVLRRQASTPAGRQKAGNFTTRVNAWWVMVAVIAGALASGRTATLAVFGLISFQALREFVTLSPTRRGDHHALFWVFFVMTPLQYLLLAFNQVGIALVMIPVYGFLFLSLRAALAGDCHRYLERISKVYWAAMICVYSVSAAPALLLLKIDDGPAKHPWRLVAFLIIAAEANDVGQYIWGNLIGGRKLAPSVSPNKTVAGFVGGVMTVFALGLLMTPLTPFNIWQAGVMAFIIAVCGTAGGLVMSAIKRDAGVKDYGQIIAGHGGVMDRIDSLTFAAPVFFHLVRYFF